MARLAQRLCTNAPGAFFVDARCINSGTCWQWDPLHFAPSGDTSHVVAQPLGEAETGAALITRHRCGDVYDCGWASRKSFGASSWLVVRPPDDSAAVAPDRAAGANVLIDSPRFNRPLARRIEALGGLAAIVLSHRDDVADHGLWAEQFGCRRWIHQADAMAAPEAEQRLQGKEPMALGGGLQLIPTPGHTAGSMVAVLGEAGDAAGPGQILFSGDHLWWCPQHGAVVASRRYCWWNWEEQVRSVDVLLDLDVRWLLPGHGERRAFGPGEWRRELERTLAHCRAERGG